MYAISWCRLLLYTFLHISISAQHYTMITRGGAVPILRAMHVELWRN
jgi:hypothetical protein